jgi:hypothetical protein
VTFLELQNDVMSRLNLTSSDARTRIKHELNTRYREVQTGVNLERTRRSEIAVTTVANNALVTVPACAKILSIFDPINLKRPLSEVSQNQLRQLDSTGTITGIPHTYAIEANLNDTVIVRFYPKPDAIYNLRGDAIVAGTEMVADGDSPSFPTDFHDILVRGVMSDELNKMEKQRPAADKEEAKFEKRLSELRYFLIKSRYLALVTTDNYANLGLAAKVWPYTSLG